MLIIEKLGNEDGDEVVGITELHNSNNLAQDELIRLATSISSDSITTQLLNGLLISGVPHLLSAAQNAINAQKGDYMLSRSLDVEIIVFASTQRQIGKALELLGVYDGLEEIAVVIVGNNVSIVKEAIQSLTEKIGQELVPPFKPTKDRFERIKNQFQISKEEIKAISDSNDVESQLSALSRCIASRVSLVAFDS
jgi:tRNA threonylcarbamoyladenosine modification (KEOPS) complex Cgi121 subunit